MDTDQLTAVCNAFERARLATPDFGERFYRRLAEDHPEIMPVFENVGMESQHSRFVGMLNVILHRIKDSRPVVPLLRDLGSQHRHYGVSEENFEQFGFTLANVLEDILGAEFDTKLRSTWLEVFREVSRIMRSPDTKNGSTSVMLG